MTLLTMAAVVGTLFATGTYLILRRRAVRLILGLGLLTHGVNLLLFSSGRLGRGLPPIVLDKKAFDGTISQYADPLPQALILTAIVISFAVTAFTVVLVNRRQMLVRDSGDVRALLPSSKVADPFAAIEHYGSGLNEDPDDYEWLEFSLADELRARKARMKDEEDAKVALAQPQADEEAESNEAEKAATALDSQDGDLSTSEAFISETDSDIDEKNAGSDSTNNTSSSKDDNNGDVAT